MQFRDVSNLSQADVLVLGGGLAGFRAAAAARALGRTVTLVSRGRGASPYVIGCNAPFGHAERRDSPEQYFKDVVAGGSELNDRRLVDALVSNATASVLELEAAGVALTRTENGFAQRQLAGNWYPRSVYHPDGFGTVAVSGLARHCAERGVEVITGLKAIALLKDGDEVCGALLLDPRKGELRAIGAASVVIALGGIGQLYRGSTYPKDVTADSYGLALDAGAALVDMEFVQFEPLVAFEPDSVAGLELPTAMLADGARLMNAAGERFMFRHNPQYGEARIEKAKLSLCIQEEIDAGRGLPEGGVRYDATEVAREKLESYVRHCQVLRKAGIEPATTGIAVRPAAHSHMGGIAIDDSGFTSVPGLYAAGEATGGLHGASRIAGNGGADALVFGGIAGRGASRAARPAAKRDWSAVVKVAAERVLSGMGARGHATPTEVKAQVQDTMAEAAGIYRTAEGLAAGSEKIERLARTLTQDTAVADARGLMEAVEARSMVLAGRSVLASALLRTESRGAHQRRDFPGRDDANWLKHITLRKHGEDSLTVTYEAIR